MTTAALLERTPNWTDVDPRLRRVDWELPAGGPPALPRLAGISYTYLPVDDSHLRGQPCLAIEPAGSDTESCLVAFACGCRAQVARSTLRVR